VSERELGGGSEDERREEVIRFGYIKTLSVQRTRL